MEGLLSTGPTPSSLCKVLYLLLFGLGSAKKAALEDDNLLRYSVNQLNNNNIVLNQLCPGLLRITNVSDFDYIYGGVVIISSHPT